MCHRQFSRVTSRRDLSRAVDDNAAVNPSTALLTGNSGGSRPQRFAPPPTPALSGETVTVPIGTLPAGKNVTIKFQVKVNGPMLPLGTTQLLNQGTVSFDPGQSTLTDDPAVVGASDPTITLVDRPDTDVVSINRSGSTPTNADPVSWTVTFADAAINLTSSNFTLVNVGLGGTPAITSVTPNTALPATQWTVTASTGTGDGTPCSAVSASATR